MVFGAHMMNSIIKVNILKLMTWTYPRLCWLPKLEWNFEHVILQCLWTRVFLVCILRCTPIHTPLKLCLSGLKNRGWTLTTCTLIVVVTWVLPCCPFCRSYAPSLCGLNSCATVRTLVPHWLFPSHASIISTYMSTICHVCCALIATLALNTNLLMSTRHLCVASRNNGMKN